MVSKSHLRILIAGGGTGGHIYPGISIAQALQTLSPGIQIQFIGSPQGLESQIVPRAGFPLTLISVGKLNQRGALFERLATLLRIPIALVRSWRFLSCFRPDFVLGVGGYASGPVLLVAALRKIPTALWEPNAIPGLTNRWLSRLVPQAFVVFENSKSYLGKCQTHVYGLPLRPEILDLQESARESSRQDQEFRVLVFGGSQGARGINQAMKSWVRRYHRDPRKIHLVHQTGKLDYAEVKEEYEKLGGQHTVKFEALEYLHNMRDRLAWSDLIICRSGASTVAEVAAAGKPSVFIPLPTAADNHQQKNAEALVRSGAALMILQQDLSPEALDNVIEDLRENPEKRTSMGLKLKPFFKRDSATLIAKKIIDLSGTDHDLK